MVNFIILSIMEWLILTYSNCSQAHNDKKIKFEALKFILTKYKQFSKYSKQFPTAIAKTNKYFNGCEHIQYF